MTSFPWPASRIRSSSSSRGPANILIRPNMAASVWQCLVAALVMMREADVFDEEGAGIPAGMLVGILNEMEEDDAASFRWAVVIDDAIWASDSSYKLSRRHRRCSAGNQLCASKSCRMLASDKLLKGVKSGSQYCFSDRP
jgi:hypothetical protein